MLKKSQQVNVESQETIQRLTENLDSIAKERDHLKVNDSLRKKNRQTQQPNSFEIDLEQEELVEATRTADEWRGKFQESHERCAALEADRAALEQSLRDAEQQVEQQRRALDESVQSSHKLKTEIGQTKQRETLGQALVEQLMQVESYIIDNRNKFKI